MNDLKITANGQEQSYNQKDYEQYRVDLYNKTKGNLEGYDCPLCNNRGDFGKLNEDTLVMDSVPCRCMKIRNSLRAIEKSGLSGVKDKLTFDSFESSTDWHKYIKDKATAFVKEDKWFYIGGQVGSGKTHICTAVTISLFKKGKDGLYMLWRDETAKLKEAMYSDGYDSKISKYKEAEVLYIDDFLKTSNKQPPSSADMNIAFEIINHRYISRLTTVISSEWILPEVIGFDEATGSRIKELTGEYLLTISKDSKKNYRNINTHQ